MNIERILWAVAAGGIGGGFLILLFPKKTQAATILGPRPPAATIPVMPAPPIFYGESATVSLSVPGGWRRLKSGEGSPDISSRAVSLRNSPGFTSMAYGTLSPFEGSDGNMYATWIEQHYHPPGGSAKPWGLHHGVTVLAKSQ